MPGSKTITCEFFRIAHEHGEEFPALEHALNLARRQTAERNFEKDGDVVRIHDFHQFPADDPCFAGILIRLRTGACPRVSWIDTDILSELHLSENEHLTEVLHFLFFPHKDIFVAERNKHVGSEYLFRDYFADKSGCSKLQCEHFLKKASAQQLAGLNRIRKLELKFEHDPRALNFEGSGESLDSILKMAEECGTRTFTLVLSVGRFKANLLDMVKEIALGASTRMGRLQPKYVRLIGHEESTASLVLDLVDAKLDVIIPVSWTERTLPPNDVWIALRDGFYRVHSDLPDRKQVLL